LFRSLLGTTVGSARFPALRHQVLLPLLGSLLSLLLGTTVGGARLPALRRLPLGVARLWLFCSRFTLAGLPLLFALVACG